MKLFMSGRKFDRAKESPTTKRTRAFLNGQKDGELLNCRQLAAAMKITPQWVRCEVGPALPEYSHLHEGARYYGNKKTVAYFKREVSKK